MTKRTLGLLSLSVTAILLCNEQAAYSSDTLWDLLRKGDPAHKRAVSKFPLNSETAMPPTAAVGGDVAAAAAPLTGTLWDLLRVGDPAHRRAVAVSPFDRPALAQSPAPAVGPQQIASAVTTGAPVVAAPARPVMSGTVWDLLRVGDPAEPRAVPVVPFDSVATGSLGQPLPAGALPEAAAKRHHTAGMFRVFDDVGDTLHHWGKALNSQITVHGQKSIGYHMEKVSGNDDTYQSDNYFGRKGIGGTYNDTDLLIQGKLFGVLNFEQHWTDRLYGNPYDNRVSLNYQTKHLKFDAGDIQAGIQGNSLIGFSRSLKGVQVSYDLLKGFRLTSLFSQTKAQTRTIVLQGANTSGPYYVYAGQVVDGSEKVRVNNKDMVKGQDYTLDPMTGQLNFKPGMIIAYTDVIAVTFESYGYGQQAGTISGYRADLTMLKGARFGFTLLQQGSPHSPTALAQRKEQFAGDIGMVYTLMYPVDVILSSGPNGVPVATPRVPMTVTADGLPLVYGADYQVNPLIPTQVLFKAPYPPTAVIYITYTPVTDPSVSGNRKVMGADASFSLGKTGNIIAEMANSSLDLPGRSVKGSAMQLRGDMRFLQDKLAWTWSLHNIGSNFTAIESPGFNQNETGLSTALNFNASKNLKFNLSFDKSKRPSYNFGNLYGSGAAYGTAQGSDNYSQINFGANYQIGKTGQFVLTHSTMSTTFTGGGRSMYGTDNLTFDYTFKSLKLDLAVGRNVSQTSYQSIIGTGTTAGVVSPLTSTTNNSLTQRANLTWTANDRLNFGLVVSNNSISGIAGHNITAQDIQFTSDITPMKNMRLTLGYQMQNSGGGALLSATTGTGTTGSTTGTTGSTTGTTGTTGSTGSASSGSTGNTGGSTSSGSTSGTTSGSTGNTTTGSSGSDAPIPGLGGGGSVRGATRQSALPPAIGGTGGTGGTSGTISPPTTGAGASYYGGLYGGSVLGGGYNANVGGYGNYSGGFYNSYTPFSSGYGGSTRAFTLAWNYQPWQALNLSLNYNSSFSQGDVLLNSRRNDLALSLSYALGSRLQFTTSMTTQKIAYIGSSGGTNTNSMMFNVHSRPIGKLTCDLNWMTMRSGSQQAQSGTTTGTTGSTGGIITPGLPGGVFGTYPGLPGSTGNLTGGYLGGYIPSFGAYSTNMNSYGIRLEYPVWKSNSLFVTFDSTRMGGFGASDMRNLMFGMNFDLGNHMVFTLGWRNQQHINLDPTLGSSYNYRVSSLDADLGMHF